MSISTFGVGLGVQSDIAGSGTRAVPEDVVAWGSNTSGQLGDGSLAFSAVPKVVRGLSGVRSLAAGDRSVLALLSDGTVMAWGDDEFGQLGDGTASEDADSERPETVSGLSGVVSVASGSEHGLALMSDGTVMAWGDNQEGQLGDGTEVSPGSPERVRGLSGVKQIAAGELYSVALLDNGTVMEWGDNAEGQLGDGSTRSSDVPVAVRGLPEPVVAVTAGWRHVVAVLADGTVMAWGDNSSDELGDGSARRYSSVPVQVSDLHSPTQVAAGIGYTLALEPDGQVMTWGGDLGGFLGGGVIPTPKVVPGVANATDIAAGGTALAVTRSGRIDDWGPNEWGQRGDGSVTQPPSGQISHVTGVSGADIVAAGSEFSVAAATTAAATGAAGAGPTSSPWRTTSSVVNPLIRPSDVVSTWLSAITSHGGGDAWAVGASDSPGPSPQPLAEHLIRGVWHRVLVPLPSGSTEAQLTGVKELSPSDVWAVGFTGNPGVDDEPVRTLIENWNGNAWTVVPSSNQVTGDGDSDSLAAIDGSSPDDLWAVGSFNDNAEDVNASILEHWNGKQWSLYPDVFFGIPTAITVSGTNDAWAAGVGKGGTGDFILSWNGDQWAQMNVPDPEKGGSDSEPRLSAITSAGPSDIWAVGTDSNVNGQYFSLPYALHWNGSTWTIVYLPNEGNPSVNISNAGSSLDGVVAISPSDIWAVGNTNNSDLLALTEHFNGRAWQMVAALHPGTDGGLEMSELLTAITTSGPHAVLATGLEDQPGGCCTYGFAERNRDA